jgi:hypothetical protein
VAQALGIFPLLPLVPIALPIVGLYAGYKAYEAVAEARSEAAEEERIQQEAEEAGREWRLPDPTWPEPAPAPTPGYERPPVPTKAGMAPRDYLVAAALILGGAALVARAK